MLRWTMLAILLFPGTQAALSLDVVAPPERIAPEAGVALITLNTRLDCMDALQLQGAGAEFTYRVDIDAPAGVFVTGHTTVAASAQACQQDPLSSLEEQFQFHVAVSVDVDADVQQSISFTVTADGDGPTGEAQTANGTTTVQAAPQAIIQVRLERSIMQVARGNATYPYTLTNHGNSLVDVSVTIADGPADALDWPVPIAPFRVARGEVHEGEIVIDIENSRGWTNEERTYRFDFTAARQGSESTVSANVLVRVRDEGLDKATPDLSMGFLLMGLALALARRR